MVERLNQARAGLRADHSHRPSKGSRQLTQVEVDHEQAVAELAPRRSEAAVADGADVEGAPHSETPNGAHASRALRTPSS